MITTSIQLVSAILTNDYSKIKSLEEQSVDVNECGTDKAARDKQGRTALELAQKYNHPRIIEILSKS